MVGPTQSMLINMIPSIGTMKVNLIDTAVEEGKLPEDNKGDSVKKKKRVSYKDVAVMMDSLQDPFFSNLIHDGSNLGNQFMESQYISYGLQAEKLKMEQLKEEARIMMLDTSGMLPMQQEYEKLGDAFLYYDHSVLCGYENDIGIAN
ncbi:hypothetical protein RHSIM_Rhsim01G0115000 [Rhododendron simsii]|uniref:Uncharacterized protein n=1 Tax=Rhododendron simsii TaxID=118357 RepID=A0A834HQU6_RHOSS|nr:hypothetical protein RHSIM_Rhsim01G0115000 [Rhododendron simsii]